MEIRTEAKTLMTQLFLSPDGVIPGGRFTPVVGVPYTVARSHEFEGVKLENGMVLKLAIKNKRHLHYKVLPV